MEQEPLEIRQLGEIVKDLRQMFIDVLQRGTLTKSWLVDWLVVPDEAILAMTTSMSNVASQRHLKLTWDVSNFFNSPIRTVIATLSVSDAAGATQVASRELIENHLHGLDGDIKVVSKDNAFFTESVLPFKDHKTLDEYVRKLKADMRKKGIDLDYKYTNELDNAPVPFKLEIKTKPASKVEYKQLESDSADDLAAMVEWAEGADASSMLGSALALAKVSYAENGGLALRGGDSSNVLIEVGEWAVKINGKLTGVISDEFKKYVCGE